MHKVAFSAHCAKELQGIIQVSLHAVAFAQALLEELEIDDTCALKPPKAF